MAGLAVVCLAYPAHAIDPNRAISQYIHERWEIERGFPGGSVSAIAQTTDGYLWMGTEKGLIRFDGLSFQLFQQAIPSSLPIGPVHALVADADGSLWILLQSTRILRYRDGKFEPGREEAEFGITSLMKRRDDAVLFSSLALGTLRYRAGKYETLSSPSEPANPTTDRTGETSDVLSSRLSWATSVATHRLAAPYSPVLSMAETTDAKVWLGTQDRGLFYLDQGRIFSIGKGLPKRKTNCLLALPNGDLWIGTDNGVVRWNGAQLTRLGLPPAIKHVQVLAMRRDRDSNVWLGTSAGLLRVNSNGVSLEEPNQRPSRPVTALFEDREGNLWMGSSSGIERLRDSAFVTYSVTGRQSENTGPIYVDQEGRAWFGPFEGGLYWLKEGKRGSVTNDRLGQDVIYSIAGNKNELWIGRRRGGLTRLLESDGKITAKTYTQADGLAQNSVYAVHESRDGTVWSGTLSGGVSELRNGHFTSYTTTNGLASNTVSSIAQGADGTMWFGTPDGLSAMSKGAWRTYTVRDGLSSDDINCLLPDSSGVLWIGTADGIAFFSAGRIHVPQGTPESLHEPIFGIAEDRNGWLWIATAGRVLQVKRTTLTGDVVGDMDVREYGLADGLHGTEGLKRYQSVVEDARGRVWFSTNRGVSVVNPERATVNPAPALVHMEAVLADGNPLDLRSPVRISAREQKTTFRFAGLSLVNPERVRYRYRLDGLDKGWSEPVTIPEASYANLGAGSYKFRVTACNGAGLWNASEAAVEFGVEPAFWQTWWFRFALVFGVGLATLALYRLRMHQLTRLLNVRFEERLAERTRIAQDLHDTLLQGVLSASMQLHVADDQLSADSPAKPIINRVLEVMGQVVEEGRNTVRGLRTSVGSAHDLEHAFSKVPQELSMKQEIGFRVIVEGPALPLQPAIRNDIYSIGREALVNAFRHSQASNIEVELEYGAHQLRVLVRDNGCGIDPEVLHSGRDGHWGLSGMRERAERIGGKLKVSSSGASGTEVDLRVPNRLAFDSNHSTRADGWFRNLYAREQETSKPGREKRAG
jgi:ligand-binding sensor domain-containing protein/signal transduction histidine kinase